MAEFALVDHAQKSPTQCFFCSDFAGPFIDTFIDFPGYGAVYVCCPTAMRPGCIGQMARMCDFYGYEEFDAVATELVETTQALHEAKAEIEELKQMDNLVNVFRKRQSRKLETPAGRPNATAS